MEPKPKPVEAQVVTKEEEKKVEVPGEGKLPVIGVTPTGDIKQATSPGKPEEMGSNKVIVAGEPTLEVVKSE